jgi:hypothetical protein
VSGDPTGGRCDAIDRALGFGAAEHGDMDLVEIKQKERIGREQAAARLRELADQLARHNDKVHLPR